MNSLTDSIKGVSRFGFGGIAGTANFAKKATIAVGTLTMGMFAMDSYNYVYKIDALWNKLNPCNDSLPIVMNLVIASGTAPHQQLGWEERCIRYRTEAPIIFANQMLVLPFVAVGCGLAAYGFHKIESGANACRAALV